MLGHAHRVPDDWDGHDFALAQVFKRPRDEAGHDENVYERCMVWYIHDRFAWRGEVFLAVETGVAESQVEGSLGPIMDDPVQEATLL